MIHGEEAHAQTIAQLAAHTHNTGTSVIAGTSPYEEQGSQLAGSTSPDVFPTNSIGSGTAFNVVQPTIILNYIIDAGA